MGFYIVLWDRLSHRHVNSYVFLGGYHQGTDDLAPEEKAKRGIRVQVSPSLSFRREEILPLIEKEDEIEFYVSSSYPRKDLLPLAKTLQSVAEEEEKSIGILLDVDSLAFLSGQLSSEAYVGQSQRSPDDSLGPLPWPGFYPHQSGGWTSRGLSASTHKEEAQDNGLCFCACSSAPVLGKSFQDTLMEMLRGCSKTNAQVYEDGGLTRQVFSKIVSNASYEPKKGTIFCLILGMELPLEDAEKLLSSAGYCFSSSLLMDVIVKDCVAKKEYRLLKVNLLLDQHGLPCLGYHPRTH